MTRKQTLARYVMTRYGLAAALTLFVTLSLLLVLADHLALNSAAKAMLDDLRMVQTVDDPEFTACTPRGGRAVLNPDGHLRPGCIGVSPYASGASWQFAREVIIKGETTGVGRMPLAGGMVVWAARVLHMPRGESVIVIAWDSPNAIRAAAGASYGLVGVAVACSFLIGALLTLRMIRSITRVLSDVTASGRRMAEGDFAVSLPEQPTTELDALTRVVSDLARHLDETLADFRDEHTRLTRLERAQRQFVADASHELRAPLSAMSLTLAAWQDGLLSPDEQKGAVTQLRGEVMRLSRMVEQLLDLSRIESGRQPISLTSVHLAPLVEAVLDGYALSSGAHIQADIAADLPPVLADEDGLYRIFRNLLDNARRFTPLDGMIRVWAQEEYDTVLVGVTDTGAGIPEDDVARVWDRFARAEKMRAQGDTGIGLGLAIVKALATAMHGEVRLESVEGEGTSVWIRLQKAEKCEGAMSPL